MKFYQEMVVNGGYSNRPLSSTETKDVKGKLKELKELQQQIDTLQKQLDKKIAAYENNIFYNSVFTDKPGIPYDVRHFVLTGKVDLV